MRFSCAKFFVCAGLLLCGCAAGLSRSDFFEKTRSQGERWRNVIEKIQNAAYLTDFSAFSARRRTNGNLEIYYVRPDTVLLFSPGFLGKGSLRGRWILGGNLLVYFPRENSFFEGSWEDFLVGRKAQTAGLDSLIFGILSRRALLPEADSTRCAPNGPGWSCSGGLGRLNWQFIFNRRGKLAQVKWRMRLRVFELEVEIDKSTHDQLSPKRVEWDYGQGQAYARFEVERSAVNVAIPAAKSQFAVPPDAKRLERVKADETN